MGVSVTLTLAFKIPLKKKKKKKIQKQHRPEGKFFIPEKEALLPLFKCYAPVSFKSHQIKVIPYDWKPTLRDLKVSS